MAQFSILVLPWSPSTMFPTDSAKEEETASSGDLCQTEIKVETDRNQAPDQNKLCPSLH
jgi:hypothetical protein